MANKEQYDYVINFLSKLDEKGFKSLEKHLESLDKSVDSTSKKVEKFGAKSSLGNLQKQVNGLNTSFNTLSKTVKTTDTQLSKSKTKSFDALNKSLTITIHKFGQLQPLVETTNKSINAGKAQSYSNLNKSLNSVQSNLKSIRDLSNATNISLSKNKDNSYSKLQKTFEKTSNSISSINSQLKSSNINPFKGLNQSLKTTISRYESLEKYVKSVKKELRTGIKNPFGNINKSISSVRDNLKKSKTYAESLSKSFNKLNTSKFSSLNNVLRDMYANLGHVISRMKQLREVTSQFIQTLSNKTVTSFINSFERGFKSALLSVIKLNKELNKTVTSLKNVNKNGNIKIRDTTPQSKQTDNTQRNTNYRRSNNRSGYDENYYKRKEYTPVVNPMMEIASFMGLQGSKELIMDTSVTNETNKLLLNKMGGEYSNFDQITNESLTSIQELIPAMNAMAVSAGLTADQVNKSAGTMADFGSYVKTLTGSEALAQSGMYYLSRAYQGQYQGVDQYGITDESLKKTGKYQGAHSGDSYEHFMEAVQQIMGNQMEELMQTTQGQMATITKSFSIAGKQIGAVLMPPVTMAMRLFNQLNKAMFNLPSQVLLLGSTALSAAAGLTNFYNDTVYAVSTLKDMKARLNKWKNGLSVFDEDWERDEEGGVSEEVVEDINKDTTSLKGIAGQIRDILQSIENKVSSLSSPQSTPSNSLQTKTFQQNSTSSGQSFDGNVLNVQTSLDNWAPNEPKNNDSSLQETDSFKKFFTNMDTKESENSLQNTQSFNRYFDNADTKELSISLQETPSFENFFSNIDKQELSNPALQNTREESTTIKGSLFNRLNSLSDKFLRKQEDKLRKSVNRADASLNEYANNLIDYIKKVQIDPEGEGKKVRQAIQPENIRSSVQNSQMSHVGQQYLNKFQSVFSETIGTFNTLWGNNKNINPSDSLKRRNRKRESFTDSLRENPIDNKLVSILQNIYKTQKKINNVKGMDAYEIGSAIGTRIKDNLSSGKQSLQNAGRTTKEVAKWLIPQPIQDKAISVKDKVQNSAFASDIDDLSLQLSRQFPLIKDSIQTSFQNGVSSLINSLKKHYTDLEALVNYMRGVAKEWVQPFKQAFNSFKTELDQVLGKWLNKGDDEGIVPWQERGQNVRDRLSQGWNNYKEQVTSNPMYDKVKRKTEPLSNAYNSVKDVIRGPSDKSDKRGFSERLGDKVSEKYNKGPWKGRVETAKTKISEHAKNDAYVDKEGNTQYKSSRRAGMAAAGGMGLSTVGGMIGGNVGGAMQQVGDIVSTVGSVASVVLELTGGVKGLLSGLSKAWKFVSEIIGGVAGLGKLLGVIGVVIVAVQIVSKYWDQIAGTVQDLFAFIKGFVITAFVEPLMPVFQALDEVWNAIMGLFGGEGSGDVLMDIGNILLEVIKPLGQSIMIIAKLIGGILSIAFRTLATTIHGVAIIIKGIVDTIKGFVGILQQAFQPIIDAVTNFFNFLNEKIGWLLDLLGMGENKDKKEREDMNGDGKPDKMGSAEKWGQNLLDERDNYEANKQKALAEKQAEKNKQVGQNQLDMSMSGMSSESLGDIANQMDENTLNQEEITQQNTELNNQQLDFDNSQINTEMKNSSYSSQNLQNVDNQTFNQENNTESNVDQSTENTQNLQNINNQIPSLDNVETQQSTSILQQIYDFLTSRFGGEIPQNNGVSTNPVPNSISMNDYINNVQSTLSDPEVSGGFGSKLVRKTSMAFNDFVGRKNDHLKNANEVQEQKANTNYQGNEPPKNNRGFVENIQENLSNPTITTALGAKIARKTSMAFNDVTGRRNDHLLSDEEIQRRADAKLNNIIPVTPQQNEVRDPNIHQNPVNTPPLEQQQIVSVPKGNPNEPSITNYITVNVDSVDSKDRIDQMIEELTKALTFENIRAGRSVGMDYYNIPLR